MAVRSLLDDFLWARHCVAVAKNEDSDFVSSVESTLATATMSTCFSGLGSPENANLALSEGVSSILGIKAKHMLCIHAIEWDNEARIRQM